MISSNIFERTPVRTKPFASTCFAGGRERELLLACLESECWSGFRAGTAGGDVRDLARLTSRQVAGYGADEVRYLGGPLVRDLELRFAEFAGCDFAVSANSATSALVMGLGAFDLGPGDEVLVPAFSFHASATCVLPWNALPVFVEVKEDTLCLDPDDLAAKITERSRAIVVVHLSGHTADMDRILEIAKQHDLRVLEDCAQSPGVHYRGRSVGSLGDAGVFSLTETKNINSGEGGVLVTQDPRIAMKARLIRNHAEAVAEDNWPDEDLVNLVGMNYRLTELQAAVAIAQLEQLDERNRLRILNADYLMGRLAVIPELVPQRAERGSQPVCYLAKWRYLPGPGMLSRDELVQALAAEGIPVVGGYRRLMHENPLFTRRIAFGGAGFPFTHHEGELNYGTGALPRSERINRELLWFAFVHPPNVRRDMDDVIHAFEKILG